MITVKWGYKDTMFFENIYGYFREDTLRKMDVIGNGESLYYAQDDSGAYIGVNEATCSRMLLYFKDEQVDRITFLEKPDAKFFPMQKIDPKKKLLSEFQWLIEKKPTKEDVIRSGWLKPMGSIEPESDDGS